MGGAAAGSDSGGDTGKVAYDKEAVDIEIKRAIRQVKGHCGSATDEEGQATGPWGSTKVNVTIGRNGHVKLITVPSPYDGKPVGKCIVQAFQRSSSLRTPPPPTRRSTSTSRSSSPRSSPSQGPSSTTAVVAPTTTDAPAACIARLPGVAPVESTAPPPVGTTCW